MHVYSVPGVQNYSDSGHVTMFSCANAGASNLTLGVEIFDAGGGPPLNDADATSIVVAPGATVLFGTGPVGGWPLDADLLGTSTVNKGSARVLATTSKGVLCSVHLVDVPIGKTTTDLSVVKKTTQQGD